MSVPADEIDAGLDERLATATLDLVNIPSVSGDEVAVLDRIGAALPEGFDVVDREDAVLFAVPSTRRSGAPFVVLAGHVDTVPHHGNFPGTRDDGIVVGRGAADMKGGLAVMLETASLLAAHPGASDLDVGLLFFGREELPITQSALLPLFDRCALTRSIDLAIVMEPTANAIEVGCLGNLNARIGSTVATAHTARPWLGRNAIHTAIGALAPIADLEPNGRRDRRPGVPRGDERDVDRGRHRRQRRARSRGGDGELPVRADPHARRRPRRGCASCSSAEDVEFTVIGNAPRRRRSRSATRWSSGSGRRADLDVGPKQAWTSVAEFGDDRGGRRQLRTGRPAVRSS